MTVTILIFFVCRWFVESDHSLRTYSHNLWVFVGLSTFYYGVYVFEVLQSVPPRLAPYQRLALSGVWEYLRMAQELWKFTYARSTSTWGCLCTSLTTRDRAVWPCVIIWMESHKHSMQPWRRTVMDLYQLQRSTSKQQLPPDNLFTVNKDCEKKSELLASNYGTCWSLVVCEYINPPKQTLYSSPWWAKLRKNVWQHEWSWRAQIHFWLSNVVSRKKIGKVFKLARSSLKSWAHICTRRDKEVKKS